MKAIEKLENQKHEKLTTSTTEKQPPELLPFSKGVSDKIG